MPPPSGGICKSDGAPPPYSSFTNKNFKSFGEHFGFGYDEKKKVDVRRLQSRLVCVMHGPSRRKAVGRWSEMGVVN